jgi:hypothetical protein
MRDKNRKISSLWQVAARTSRVRPGGRALRLLGTLTVLLAAATTSDAGTWKLEVTPNPARAAISVLASVSCPARRACTAVGSSADTPSSPTLPLAERWDGKRWRIQPAPAPPGSSDTLSGVSCSSARACTTVGSAFFTAGRRNATLAEAWDGKRWRVQPTPAVKGPASLFAVSCTSRRSCFAVGHTLNSPARAIVERWDGRTWRTQALPRAARNTAFAGVSCSSARACTAVGWGGNSRPRAVAWNGKQWRVQAVPSPRAGMLSAVSCTSPNACTATGTELDSGGTALAERWNGKRWRVQPTPNPADYRESFGSVDLDGVSCTSARACVASGDYSPHGAAAYFVESWDGKQWRLEATPFPADFARGALLAISCAASQRCTAVGAYTGRVRIQVTLALAR